mmetsp:Transcript_44618/g.126120  ORF Transcript_44618/g.126120 Transcript_44618/m.126120 type:complete len:93 (+) Transcript_44618:218-496(+)
MRVRADRDAYLPPVPPRAKLNPGEHNGRSKRRFDMLNSTFTGCEDTSKNQVVRIRIKPCEKLQGSSQLNAACEMYQGAPKPMCQINNRSDFV